MLAERKIMVRSLSSWTKEDAAEWVLTLGMIEPSIRTVSRDLSQEFVNQNVTGAKIAGGLLDRGALHFAFGLEDMNIAQFFANVILDLNKVRTYLPVCMISQPRAVSLILTNFKVQSDMFSFKTFALLFRARMLPSATSRGHGHS